jgi:hypothetical protein
MADSIHDQIHKDRWRQRKTWMAVKKYRLFADGEQEFLLTEGMKEILAGLWGENFVDNACHTVVAEAGNRLEFEGWKCPNDGVAKKLNEFMTTSRLRDRSGSIHYDALRDGNFAAIVSWNEESGRAEMQQEPWYDGSCGMFVCYDQNDRPKYAVKDWMGDDDLSRRTIYWPDRIERWKGGANTTGAEWVHDILEEDEGQWPVPWKKKDGSPIGLPVVHFGNAGRDKKNYGTSELINVLGLQNQLTGLQWDMSAAARMGAFQIYTATGVDEETKMSVGAGKLWRSKNKEASFGHIPAGDPAGLLSIYNTKLQRFAQITSTPHYMITGGDWPSGEALLRAEQPAVGKATRQINRMKDSYTRMGRMVIVLNNVFGGESLPEDAENALVSSLFAPPDRRDMLTRSIIVMNLKDLLSPEMALRMIGMSDEDIEKNKKEKDAALDEAMDRQETMMARGLGIGTGMPGKGPGLPGASGGAGPAKPGTPQPKPGGGNK